MLKRDEILQAVELHRRSYKLLRWLSTAIDKGVVGFARAHDYMDEAAAAEDWIKEHYASLPASCRPATDQVAPFAKFFATYLTTSFDLIEQPGQELKSGCGCFCPLCAYLTAAPHLKTKKVTRRDKERARKIKLNALEQLALEHNAHMDRERAEKLLDSPETASEISLLAYGRQLVERTHGRSHGPAVLALWREIAWEKTGAPKKDYQLEPEAILRAEQSLVARIVGAD